MVGVYVEFKEKFHGKLMKGTHLRKYKSKMDAKREVARWNALNPRRDKIIVKKIHESKPKGFRKTKYPNIWKK
jgi:hypothetical protein